MSWNLKVAKLARNVRLSKNLNIRSCILKPRTNWRPLQTITYNTYACTDPFWYHLRFMGRSLTWFLTLRKHSGHLTLACVYFAYPIILDLITLKQRQREQTVKFYLWLHLYWAQTFALKRRPKTSYVMAVLFPTVATGLQAHKKWVKFQACIFRPSGHWK
jgi:hypothetical protein